MLNKIFTSRSSRIDTAATARGRRRTPLLGSSSVDVRDDERPLRAELFSIHQLETHAMSMASWHEVTADPRRSSAPDKLLRRLADNERVLRETYELVTEGLRRKRAITPAAEWFLDNFHLIEEQIRAARRHLPRGYSRELPRLVNGAMAGYPRVYDLALELISHADGRVDLESLRAFVSSYQSVKPLRLGELWAIPIMLRLALIENLRRVAARIAAGRREREVACHWIEHIVASAERDPASVVLALADMVKADPPLTNAFVAEFTSRLHGHGPALLFPMTWLEQRITEHGLSIDHVFQQVSQSQAADQLSIGNTIGSLRFLGAMEWRDFVESMSVVEQSLRSDPAGVYARMDFATRDRYRHAVEEIARGTTLAEDAVAQKAVELARLPQQFSASADDVPAAAHHVGYFLIDRGRRTLERAVDMRPTLMQRMHRMTRGSALALYMAAITFVTAMVVISALWWSVHNKLGWPGVAVVALLSGICASQLAISIVHWIATMLLHPRVLPRMDFSHGIPAEHATAVVVPAMLANADEVEHLVDAMEVRYLANADSNLSFCLLTDFPDASQENMPGDESLLQQAIEAIDALNRKYAAPGRELHTDGNVVHHEDADAATDGDGVFYLFHRPRRWNPQEGAWMGWERKRGKLEQFNAAVRGDASGFSHVMGNLQRLNRARYVITLDSDTQLPRETARQLVGTMAHVLNRPQYSEKLGRVIEGYTILQPRVGISTPSAARSRFSRLFAGEAGLDPYTRAVSDVYQDVFSEGSFVGKGIYDIDSFQRALANRLPENRILSHDLLEGAYARSGLISDVVLFEDYPTTYPVDVSRRIRWIRGDWQIAQWLMRNIPGSAAGTERNPISFLSRWKILDNMRRSVVAVAILLLLLLGFFLPDGGPAFFTLLVVAIFVLPGLFTAINELTRRPGDLPWIQHVRLIGRSLLRQLAREGFNLAAVPYEAVFSIRAISQTAVRLLGSKQKLLEWRTAADAQRNARGDLGFFHASMLVQIVIAIATAVALLIFNRHGFSVALPLLVLWLAFPTIAWHLSRPIVAGRANLFADDVRFLRIVARRTWRFFEVYVGATDNHLPPDNVQEDPPRGAAHRTSPTNIGLSLLANLTAYDFGYITGGEIIGRTQRTLATMERMQSYRGHLYNWYDTRSLEPLPPMYVSSVDSGNLAGHLIVLSLGLREMGDQKIVRPEIIRGLEDTLAVVMDLVSPQYDGAAQRQALPPDIQGKLARLKELASATPYGIPDTRLLLQRIAAAVADLASEVASRNVSDDLKWWSRAFEEQCRYALEELDYLTPWVGLPGTHDESLRRAAPRQVRAIDEIKTLLRHLDQSPTLAETARLESAFDTAIDNARAEIADGDAQMVRELGGWLDRVANAIREASARADYRLKELNALATRCTELADIDYEFLYDRSRNLLAIGYNVAEHRLDASFYDLLASEARLASFVAIAQGKLPQDHWFSLGRLLTNAGGHPALLSWSGSMFEYLMPLLVMPTYENTLLDETYRAVVQRQIEYGRERGVPWGVSESGYYEFDTQLNYQYRAFGVPGLGFKRGLAEDLVIAPYATVMSLMVNPEAACANLRRLARDGQMGQYGFYEAVDYTPSRMQRNQKSVTIKSFMVHHQGMGFLSLAYLLLNRPMQRRFDSDAAFRATDLLLQERIPKTPSVYPHPAEVSEARVAPQTAEANFRVFATPNTPIPEVHLLSNGRYNVAVTAAGGGYSRWRDLAVTRWREDPTRDAWGTFCYLRDTETGAFWSTAYQPTLKRAENYEAIYSQGRAEYRRRDDGIDTHVEIAVSPEDDIELRRITLSNRGRTARTIEITSYAEVTLTPPAADAAHPAFSNLFVQSQLLRDRQAILCTRRPRSGGERPPWMMHLMTAPGQAVDSISYETSRADFIGRGRDISNPAAMHRERLTDSQGSVLDPIVAIRLTVRIEPNESARVQVVTGVADSRERVMELVEKYYDAHLADRVFELAWTQSQVVLRQLDVTESDTQLFGRLASRILYSNAQLRAPGTVIARNRRGQSGLWGYGISGDLPIVLLRMSDMTHAPLARQMIRAHTYWRAKGLQVDLVIWNEDQSGYRQNLHEMITGIIASVAEANLVDKPGGIFVRRIDQMSEEDKVLMQTVARVIISDTAGTLAEQIDRRPRAESSVPRFSPVRTRKVETPVAVEITRPDLAAFNGSGGFTQDGREYVITTTPESPTPAPWVNVIANPWFGSVVSESGSAYTWCENAHSYRLTPWNNDPVADASGEAFYIRDEETGRFWSPSPQPARGQMPYTARHGFGYSIFDYTEAGISSEMQTYVATDAPVKFMVVTLRNNSGSARRLSITGFFELVLGAQRPANMPHVVTEVDPKTNALFARNPYNNEFAERVAFLDTSETQRTISGDRAEFLGRNGSPANPACMHRTRLSGRTGAGLDPCMGMQVMIDLADGQERKVVFTFGSGRDLHDARNLVNRFRGSAPARTALEAVWAFWNRTLGTLYVETPDQGVNFLANGWLLYQVLSCRMWGRSGFYQSGGAFGFRDQLQDSMAMVHALPTALRDQLIRSAEHQFREGDVQHWWHPPTGRGVRTRISDDYLWLPYATCRYINAIGDTGVLDESIRFLDGRPVKPDEESYYDLPGRSEETATLYEHCVRAIRNGLKFGVNGLPLMGCGDWNDGMNLVGEHGKGESVWLGLFLYDVLNQFAEIARKRSDTEFADLCTSEATKVRQNFEANAWDGSWYRRAYFDNGEPLGSSESQECKIDSLPQSWSVLTGAGSPDRNAAALESLDTHLVKRDLGLIQLFEPPFDKSHQNPGYIKGYVPGVRENGGQYTHAAVWTVMAFAAAGNTERAWELFRLINPIHHGDSEERINIYKVEPYVVAADVYANPQHAGRGGWTWYTGSAGWMYRLITESLLGIHLEVDRLRIAPVIPNDWDFYKVHYRFRETYYHITIQRKGPANNVQTVRVDGTTQREPFIPLIDDQRDHAVEVEIG